MQSTLNALTKDDMAAKKKKSRRGPSTDKRMKLTDGQCRAIRKLYKLKACRKKGGMSQAEIARKFGLSVIHINRICNGAIRLDAGGPVSQVDY